MSNDAYNLFISFILCKCDKIIKALKALCLLWRYLPGIHPPVCHQELIHPSPPARQQRAAVSCSVEGDTFTMQSRDGVSEPTVGWWQEGELWTVNWAVIDCFLPHNRYHNLPIILLTNRGSLSCKYKSFSALSYRYSSNGKWKLFAWCCQKYESNMPPLVTELLDSLLLAAAPPGNHISFIWRAAGAVC